MSKFTEMSLIKKENEFKLWDYLLIIEANYIWSKKFLDLVIYYKNLVKDEYAKQLYIMDLYQNSITSLAQHFNQIYFNIAVLNFTSLLSYDDSELSLLKYFREYFKGDNRKIEDLKILQNQFKDTGMLIFRHKIIAHKNYEQVESLQEIYSDFINSQNYNNMKDMVTKTENFMKKYLSLSPINYTKEIDGYFVNEYRDRHEKGINAVINLIEKELKIIVKSYKTFKGKKRIIKLKDELKIKH